MWYLFDTYAALTPTASGPGSKSEGKQPAKSPPPQDESKEIKEDRLGVDSAPESPHTAHATAIQNLTMPPVPNFSIPPSPPGSPPPRSTKKFAQFLELKKKGVHFNEKLAKNPALKNPSMFKKQLAFAGLEDEDQYINTLSDDIVPVKFPKWAFTEELNKSQETIKKRRETQQAQQSRSSVDFVPATASNSTADKIKAGLQGSAAPEGGRQKDLERRGGRFDKRPRHRSRSRSPRRR